jgi:glucokinase
MTLNIGVDIGGTKLAAGVVAEDGTVVQATRRETPSAHPQAIEDAIAEVVDALRQGHDIAAVGVGAAGFVDSDRSVVLFAPNLAWRKEPLRDEVAKRVGLPVVVENDANAAAWAETRFGAGRGHTDTVTLTIGTGIGGGIVIDGNIYRGAFGVGAEMGHMEVVRDGLRCGCGQRGCWEQYASGRALLREAREIATSHPRRAELLLDAGDGDPDGFGGVDVSVAARAGDEAAVEAFRVVGEWLGHGIASLAAVLDPSVFIVGGGVSEAGELLLGPARAAFLERLSGAAYRPIAEIRQAELGNNAGLVGAADLARQPR